MCRRQARAGQANPSEMKGAGKQKTGASGPTRTFLLVYVPAYSWCTEGGVGREANGYRVASQTDIGVSIRRCVGEVAQFTDGHKVAHNDWNGN